MTDHANELRRHARKIPHPQGETPGVMLRAADEIECLRAKIEQMEQQGPSEQDASVRKAWARFSHELHRSPDAPYPGMADAFEQHFSQSFIDREWRAEAATWAAAWKAAKRHCGQIAPSVPMDMIADYLVSISAHLARRDDAKAQAEIVELLKMIASAPKPGASVPEDVMRDAERYRYLRARDDGTAGVGCWIEADGRVCDRGWLYGVQLDSAIDSFIEVLAAAPKPEAKP